MSKITEHKYAAIGFIYLFGLICAFFIGNIAAFILSGLLAVVFIIGINRFERIVLLYIAVFAAALLIFGMYNVAFADRSHELVGKTAVVDGIVTEKRSHDNDTVLLSISGKADGVPVDFTLFATDGGVSEGDRVQFTARFSELRDNTWFSESSYYYSKGIFLKARAVSEIQLEKGGVSVRGLITRFSDWCKSRVDAEFSTDTAGIIKAMLFGDKSDLTPLLSSCFRRSGIAHLMAVSGMHLSLLVHTFAVLVKLICGGRLRVTSFISVVFTVILMMFFGMTASVMRSGIMMIIYYSSAFFYRKSSAFNSVGVALFIILAFNPCACIDTGLWLSVLGTIGVGTVAPAVLEKLGISENKLIISSLITSFCAALCTAPVGMLCFGGISLVSAVTGILVQPFFTLILITVPVALALPFSFSPLLFPAGMSAELMGKIAEFMSSLPFAYYTVSGDVLMVFGAALIIVVSVSVLISGKGKYAAMSAISMAAACVFSISVTEIAERDNLRLKVYSDGSNALLTVEGKNGKAIYTLSDSEKICDMIYRCGTERVSFVCIGENTDNNKEIETAVDCRMHLPESGNMRYDVNGEYSVIVGDGEIVLDINGICVGFMSVKNERKCDISIYTGYSKNFSSSGNYATILCDKRFYNCGKAVNACYTETEIIIDEKGRVALEIN